MFGNMNDVLYIFRTSFIMFWDMGFYYLFYFYLFIVQTACSKINIDLCATGLKVKPRHQDHLVCKQTLYYLAKLANIWFTSLQQRIRKNFTLKYFSLKPGSFVYLMILHVDKLSQLFFCTWKCMCILKYMVAAQS